MSPARRRPIDRTVSAGKNRSRAALLRAELVGAAGKPADVLGVMLSMVPARRRRRLGRLPAQMVLNHLFRFDFQAPIGWSTFRLRRCCSARSFLVSGRGVV